MINRILTRAKYIWRNTPFGRVKKVPEARKWGFIGTGYMSDTFARAISGSKDNILYAVVSRSIEKARKFSKGHGNPVPYSCIEDMLADKNIDIVYVATPVECHYEQVKKCLEARKNVLCEKPLTMYASEAKELFRIAKENNCFLMEGMWTMCLPTMRIAKKWIKEGRIGHPQLVRADLNKRLLPEHVRKHHGVLYDYGIYGIAFVHSFMNRLDKVISVVSRKDTEGNISDISIQYETDSCKGILNLCSNLEASSKAVIIGSDGSIEWNSPFNRTNTIRLFNKNGVLSETYSTRYKEEGFEFELDEVTRLVKSGISESELITEHDTVHCLAMINDLSNE